MVVTTSCTFRLSAGTASAAENVSDDDFLHLWEPGTGPSPSCPAHEGLPTPGLVSERWAPLPYLPSCHLHHMQGLR